ncbi:MAG: YbaB/EbfC family nucleoid-associated protein [Candidatus Midichloria sp.]|nr:MAG: YbaB/EbfC family nucleoid-associated protein [Candidatus Midichloria sp.]
MNIQHMMKQAQMLQKKMNDIQQQLENVEVTGSAGGGLVTCVTTAKGVIKKVNINKDLMNPEEVEVLEDLICASLSDAKRKADELVNQNMSSFGLPPDMMKMMS